MYLVAVTFEITAAEADAFGARVHQQAVDSLTETGCSRFDVWRDPVDPTRFFLFEIYDDREAFDVHLASAHFKAFDSEVASWIAEKRVETWTLS